MTSAPSSSASPFLIVFANEKGGTGKSTTCVHTAVALAAQDIKVAVIDLDFRQRTVARYLENRTETARRRAIELPTPVWRVHEGDAEGLDAVIAELAQEADVVIIDTPGRDDPVARHAATRANTLVTPMNAKEFGAFIQSEMAKWKDAVSKANVKLE